MGSVAAFAGGQATGRAMASSDSLKVVPKVTQRGEGDLVAGRYRLVRKVGSGGMGSVWLAQDLSLDAHCAIKLIDGEKAHDESIRMRFEREAKASAQLRSAHVVNVFDYGIWNQTQYLAMEYLDGEDLAVRLMRLGRLDYETTYRIIAHVSRALMSAHSIGIVHRDLKPENIFLVQNYDEEIAKVLDFGIAQHNAYALQDRATREGAFLGTPCYVSPEQARGRPIDHRSDLWSLGVITFQCLTARLPFEGTALGELMGQILYEPLPKPTRLAPDLPSQLDAWWERAAARNREHRFQSAKEMADQLGEVLGIESVVLVPIVPPRHRASFPPAAEHSGVITAQKVPLAAVRTTAPAPESDPAVLAALSSAGADLVGARGANNLSTEATRLPDAESADNSSTHSEVDLYIAMLAPEPLVPQAGTPANNSLSSVPTREQEADQAAVIRQSLDIVAQQELEARAVLALLAASPTTEARAASAEVLPASLRRVAQESQVRFVESPEAVPEHYVLDESEESVPAQFTAANLRGRLIYGLSFFRTPSKHWAVIVPLIAATVLVITAAVLLTRGRSSSPVAAGKPLSTASGQAAASARSMSSGGPSSTAETLTVDMLPLIKRKAPNVRQDVSKPGESNDLDESKRGDPAFRPGGKAPRPVHPARDYGI